MAVDLMLTAIALVAGMLMVGLLGRRLITTALGDPPVPAPNPHQPPAVSPEIDQERHLEHLRALQAIDLAIARHRNHDPTLAITVQHIADALQVDAARLLVVNQPGSHLVYAADHGFRSRLVEQTCFDIDHGLRHPAVVSGGPIMLAALPGANQSLGLWLPPGEQFQCYHAIPLFTRGALRGVLEILHRGPLVVDPEWTELARTLAGQVMVAIETAELRDDLQRSQGALEQLYDAMLDGWVHALDLRDKETEGHTRRVTELSVQLARALGGLDDMLVHVRRGALLHDIGKIGIPDSILHKPGPLTDEEWVIMRRHPVYAYEMLAPIAFLGPAIDIPHYHHERWDGSGYPAGLAGQQIPLIARIFSVVDVWDAIRHDRPYCQAWPVDRARAHIQRLAGQHFDPAIVPVFLSLPETRPEGA